jgi:putative membrane protein
MVHLAVIVLFAAVVINFVAQNFQTVTISFLRFSAQTPIAFVIAALYLLGTATGGSLFTLLRGSIEEAKGRAASTRYIRACLFLARSEHPVMSAVRSSWVNSGHGAGRPKST